MIKIKKENYINFYKLFEETKWELTGFAVLKGNNPGKLFADSEENPTSALMMTPEGWLLVGNPENENFNQELKQYFENQILINYDDDEFEVYFQEKWRKTTDFIFSKRPLFRYKRYNYKIWRKEFSKFEISIPEGFKLEKIDSEFVKANPKMRNMDQVNDWILDNWGSYDNFDQIGFGYYILKDEIVVSWSLADCLFENKCEIGIYTDYAHRKQGFAAKTVKAMLNYAFEKGVDQIGWQCGADNIGSFKTAEKCGFKRQMEYYGNFGLIDEREHYFSHIMSHFYLNKDSEKALKVWNEVKKKYEFENYHYYDLACGFAINDLLEKSFEVLKLAIDKGFNHKKHIMNDPDLENLRRDEKWSEIVQKL